MLLSMTAGRFILDIQLKLNINIMEFNEYQKEASKLAIYNKLGNFGDLSFLYPVLGLAGETGEVVEKVKKLIRDKDIVIDDEFKEDLKKELGDVLWYLQQVCREFEISLDDVASSNLEKLYSRKDRSKLHGDGDNR